MKKQNLPLLCAALVLAAITNSSSAGTMVINLPYIKTGSIQSKIWNGAKIVIGAAALVGSVVMAKNYLKNNEQSLEKNATDLKNLFFRKAMENAVKENEADGTKLTIEKKEEMKAEFQKYLETTKQKVGENILDVVANSYKEINNHSHKTSALYTIPTGLAGLACIINGIKGLRDDFNASTTK